MCAGRTGRGAVLARFGGRHARAQAEDAERLLRDAGLATEIVEDDDSLWQAQRAGSARRSGLVVKVSGAADRPAASCSGLPSATAPCWSAGPAWVSTGCASTRPGREPRVAQLRGRWAAQVLDRPAGLEAEPAAAADPGARELERRVKERFDPDGRLV